MRHTSVLVAVVVLFVAGCGGGGAGVPGGTTGNISGTISASSTFSVRAPAGRLDTRRGPGPRHTPVGPARMVPDQILVKFRAGISPAQTAESHRLAGGAEMKRSRRTGVALVRITSGEPVNKVLSRYRADSRVAYAEPNYIRYLAAAPRAPQATPNDPGYSVQWHYGNTNFPAAWDVTMGSSLVIVAVIDTGILFGHLDLANTTVSGFDFVPPTDSDPSDPGCLGASDTSHGTHVAGTVAAATNNSIGVAGTNWGGSGRTKLMPLRVFSNIGGECGTTTDRVVDAIEWAADHSARVINMSFGGTAISQAEQDAVNYASAAGVVLVAAVGNDNINCTTTPFYPAAYANVIGVAATSITNTKASYSNFGNCVDLAAPGGDGASTDDLNGDGEPDWVLSTMGTAAAPTQYFWSAGTSMASPHVAGLAALLISKGVTGPANVENVMKTTATNLGAGLGSGLINAASAVGAPAVTNPVRVFSGSISGNAITRSSDTVSAASNGTYSVTSVQPGTWTVFAWQDTNANGVIDGSDLFGSAAGITVAAGGTTTGVNFSVKEVPTGSTPITVSGVRLGPAVAGSAFGG